MPRFEITYSEIGETKGRYALRVPGEDGEGELTVSRMSPGKWIADHVGVPPAMRGSGAARALVERLIADARAEGRRIVPLCPYVKALARRHRDDWADVIEG